MYGPLSLRAIQDLKLVGDDCIFNLGTITTAISFADLYCPLSSYLYSPDYEAGFASNILDPNWRF
jgi:hypothetical protein